MLNFSNPEPVSSEEMESILTLDFKKPDKVDPTTLTPEVPKIEEGNSVEDINPLTPEEAPVVENSPWTDLINKLAEKEFITEPYEGFNEEEDATEEVFLKMVEHNLDKKVEGEIQSFFDGLSENTRRIVEFDLNTNTKDKPNLDVYLRTLLEEHNIKNLDVSNEYDQEKILKEWYSRKEGFTREEVDEKISTLKEAGILEKEAKMIKPKLDGEAEKIAKQKEKEQSDLKAMETKVKSELSDRVLETLKKGKVKDVTLNKEEAANLYMLLTEDEIEVKIHGGRKAMMSPLEAIVFHNKYDKNGSLENLALATLLLTNPKKFEEVYKKEAHKKEVEEFAKEHKYNSALKRNTNPTEKVSGNSSKYNFRLKIPN